MKRRENKFLFRPQKKRNTYLYLILVFFIIFTFSFISLLLSGTDPGSVTKNVTVHDKKEKEIISKVCQAHIGNPTPKTDLVLNKTVYSFWKGRTPKTDEHNFLEILEGQTAGLESTQLVSVVAKELTVFKHIEVPVNSYLWARNVTRSAKTSFYDKVVVVSTLWAGFHDFTKSMVEKNVVYIILNSDTGTMTALPELKTFFVDDKEKDKTIKYLALIEIADLYISFENTLLIESLILQTPTLLVSSIKEDTFHPNIQTELLVYHGILDSQLLAHHTNNILQSPKVDVMFHSYLDPTMGYGSSAEQMALALHRRNLTLRYLPKSTARGIEYSTLKQQTIELLENNKLSDVYIGYFVPHEADVANVHRFARKAKLAYIYTTFETTRVPVVWPGIINNFDKLLVSCPDIKESFSDTGVTIPIDIVPLGVETADWPYMVRPEESTFRFLLFADSAWANHRKNYPLVYAAFKKEFTAEDKVELIIKISRKDPEFKQLESKLPKNVIVHTGRFSQSKLLQIMKFAHCFVFPSHGEGYGLPPREAMSTGLPAILAGFAGLYSVANPKFNYPLQWSKEPAVGYAMWSRENNGSSYFGDWAHIEVDEVAAKMREARNNPKKAKDKGNLASVFVRQYETYDHTGLSLVQTCNLPNWFPDTAVLSEIKGLLGASPSSRNSRKKKKGIAHRHE